MKKDNQILCVSFHKMQQKIIGGGAGGGQVEWNLNWRLLDQRKT